MVVGNGINYHQQVNNIIHCKLCRGDPMKKRVIFIDSHATFCKLRRYKFQPRTPGVFFSVYTDCCRQGNMTGIIFIFIAHLLTIFHVGAQESSPDRLSVDREINILQSCLFSKHFVSFSDVFFPFRWLLMLSSHLSLGLPLGVFPFIFNFITTLSVDSSPLLMTWPNHQSVFLLIT